MFITFVPGIVAQKKTHGKSTSILAGHVSSFPSVSIVATYLYLSLHLYMLLFLFLVYVCYWVEGKQQQ